MRHGHARTALAAQFDGHAHLRARLRGIPLAGDVVLAQPDGELRIGKDLGHVDLGPRHIHARTRGLQIGVGRQHPAQIIAEVQTRRCALGFVRGCL